MAVRNRWQRSVAAMLGVRSAALRGLVLALVSGLCLSWSGGAHATPTALAAAPEPPRELFLEVGDQATLPSQGVKSFSEGVAGIVELRVPRDGEQFVVVALRPGTTALLFFLFDGREREVRVTVRARDEAPVATGIVATDNIRLDLYFVQVSESAGHQLGIGYPDSIGGSARLSTTFDLASGALSEASIGIADQILPRLDLAQSRGHARVSSQASVVAENGKQALFHSGGEVNVRVQGALTAEVRSIRYGSQLEVAPRFDPVSRRIELTVNAEVATLTEDGGTGIPGRQVSTLNTVINLDLGKSLVLAGLSTENDARGSRGLPGLSRIPLIGGLFGSRSFRSERLRNFLVIVPCVVQAVARAEQDVVRELLQVYRDFDGLVAASKFPETPKNMRSPDEPVRSQEKAP